MDCKVCGEKNIRPSMGGDDVCGACDCGGMVTIGGITYIRKDFLGVYGYERKAENKNLEEILLACQRAIEDAIGLDNGLDGSTGVVILEMIDEYRRQNGLESCDHPKSYEKKEEKFKEGYAKKGGVNSKPFIPRSFEPPKGQGF